jgi:hypothetical protein
MSLSIPSFISAIGGIGGACSFIYVALALLVTITEFLGEVAAWQACGIVE